MCVIGSQTPDRHWWCVMARPGWTWLLGDLIRQKRGALGHPLALNIILFCLWSLSTILNEPPNFPL